MPEIDYSEFTTDDEVAEELEKRKSSLHRLVKLSEQTLEQKKDMAKSFNETLKELKEQIAHEVAAIDGLVVHRKTMGWSGK